MKILFQLLSNLISSMMIMKSLFESSFDHLAAVISNQTVRHANGETSRKHEATIANIDQDNSLAFINRDSPGHFCFSHTANIWKSSTGTHMLSSGKGVSLLFSGASENGAEPVFFFDCIPLKTVNI
jgi:hypothetical protein